MSFIRSRKRRNYHCLKRCWQSETRKTNFGLENINVTMRVQAFYYFKRSPLQMMALLFCRGLLNSLKVSTNRFTHIRQTHVKQQRANNRKYVNITW